MLRTAALWSFILIACWIFGSRYFDGVEGAPANIEPSIEQEVARTSSSFTKVLARTFNHAEGFPENRLPQLLHKKANDTIDMTSPNSDNGPESDDDSDLDEDDASTDLSSEEPLPSATPSVSTHNPPKDAADTSWIYYLVCGHSTSMTMGDYEAYHALRATPLPRSISYLPPPASSYTSKAEPYPKAVPGAGSPPVIPTVTSPPRPIRRDSAGSVCSDIRCIGSSCEPIATSSSTSSSTRKRPCEIKGNSAGTGSCVCTNGATISPFRGVCPWTALPPQASRSTGPPTTSGIEYPFTTTSSGDVIECKTWMVSPWDITDTNTNHVNSYCYGSSAIISTTSQKPSVTVEIGNSSINVGTLTGPPLYTTVSSALSQLCPGASLCSMGDSATVTVDHVPYIDVVNEMEDRGQLMISVLASSFNSVDMRDFMIGMIALAVNSSATGKSCWNETNRDYNPVDPFGASPETKTACNAAGFIGFQYVDASGFQYLDAYFEFRVEETKGEWICDEVIENIGSELQGAFPEFKEGIKLGEMGLNLVCQIAAAAATVDETSAGNGLSGFLSVVTQVLAD
ncbi:hypothetical protein EV356DRAFT_517324 [Viridothelium virens]|uniref:Glycoside hydrolase family 18 protein n=1 Tax=Viridothelium virens TaxID=1048519 RepID=A0A6A6H394_VIRVR|nr:hypothetical protein EV356DRAFT_517324 [Viridothelium virens]